MLLKGLMDICFIMYLTKMYKSFFQSLRGNSPGNCDIYGKIIGSHAVALPFSNCYTMLLFTVKVSSIKSIAP